VMIQKTLWEAYCSSVVTFKDDENRNLRIVPASGISGTWLDGPEINEIYIVSAANPYSKKLLNDSNLKSERMMKAEFDKNKFKYRNCQGESPDGIWVERSLMVFNAPLETMRKIGEHYLQNAIFRWTPSSWECISLVSNQHFTTGWKIEI
jgi:hypothetical protein